MAERYGVSREDQDHFAIRSQSPAGEAIAEGHVAPDRPGRGASAGRRCGDEHPRPDVTLEEVAAMRPAFWPDGSVTAANSSGINDGAAGVVLMRESEARRRRLTPRLR